MSLQFITGLAREQQEVAALQNVSSSLRAEEGTLRQSLTALQDMLTQQEQEYQKRSTGQPALTVTLTSERTLCLMFH
jgi:hypothetical protein